MSDEANDHAGTPPRDVVPAPSADEAAEPAPWDVTPATGAPELEPGPAVYEPDPEVYAPRPDDADGERRRFGRLGSRQAHRRATRTIPRAVIDNTLPGPAPTYVPEPEVYDAPVEPPTETLPTETPPPETPPPESPPEVVDEPTETPPPPTEPAPEIVDEPTDAAPEPAPEVPPSPEAAPQQRRRGRLGRVRRRRPNDSPADVPDEVPATDSDAGALELPEPDPSFDAPWPRGATRPRPRPGPGPAGTAPRRPRPGPGAPVAGHPRPGPGTAATSRPVVDLTRFLDASQARPEDIDAPRDAAGEKDEDDGSGSGSSRSWTRTLVRFAIFVGIAVGAWFLLRTFVVEPYYIPSESMEPTLHGCAQCVDDRVLVDKVTYRFHDPQQGDVVVFDRPPGAGLTEPQLIKRVIGVPGDKIVLRGGKVYINGKVLVEKYLSTRLLASCGGTQKLTGQDSWTVPTGDLFVMGDNRCHSEDSRYFGPIKQSSVVGRAFLRFWPLGRFGRIH